MVTDSKFDVLQEFTGKQQGHDFRRVLALLTRGEVHRRSTLLDLPKINPETRPQMTPRTVIGTGRFAAVFQEDRPRRSLLHLLPRFGGGVVQIHHFHNSISRPPMHNRLCSFTSTATLSTACFSVSIL